MKRLPLVVLATVLLVTVAFAPFGGASPRYAIRSAISDDRPTNNRQSVDKTTALVQLVGDPVSTDARTKPPKGKKIDFDNGVVKSVRAQLSAERNDFKQWLKQTAPRARVTGQFDI